MVGVTCLVTSSVAASLFLLVSFQEFFEVLRPRPVTTFEVVYSIAGTRNERLLCSPSSGCNTPRDLKSTTIPKGSLVFYQKTNTSYVSLCGRVFPIYELWPEM